MGYVKTTWTDRVVQYAKRYTLTLISGSTYDIDAAPGTVTDAGIGVTAARMNNIETGIEQAAHTGSIKMWPTKWAPAGWLERNGQAISRTTYADLFAVMTNPQVFTVTIASPAVFSATAHKFTAGDPVRFTTTGALPTGLDSSTTYYVISAGLTADAFEVSTSVGGSAVNTSGSQSGVHTARYFGVVGVGDGSTTFTLPDDRGYVERGWDNGRGVDSGRVFGSYQADNNKAHTHTGTTASDGAHTHTYDDRQYAGSGGLHPTSNGDSTNAFRSTGSAGAHTHTFTTASTGATEVTVKNVAYMPIIKY